MQRLLLEPWPIEMGDEEGKVTWKTELQQARPMRVVTSSLIQDSQKFIPLRSPVHAWTCCSLLPPSLPFRLLGHGLSVLVSLSCHCLTKSSLLSLRCLTLEGTARRSAAAEAAIMSATEVANTRDGGHGRDRAAASVIVGTVGKTVTTFGPGGESAKTRQDLEPCGVSPAQLEATMGSPASGGPRPCSLICSEL